MMREILFFLFSIILHSNGDISQEEHTSSNILRRVGPPLFGTRSTTERPLWELVPPFPAEAGHRLFAPRPEYLKSQIHFPKRDPGELVYGNEENIGQGYEGPEPGTVMRISGSRSKRSLKFFPGDPGFRKYLYPIYNGYRRMPYNRNDLAHNQHNHIKRDVFKEILNRHIENINYLHDKKYNERNVEDINNSRFRPRKMKAIIPHDNILNNIHKIYKSPIHVDYNFNVFESPKKSFQRKLFYDDFSEENELKPENPATILLPNIDINTNGYYGLKKFDMYSKKKDEYRNENEELNPNIIINPDVKGYKDKTENENKSTDSEDDNEEQNIDTTTNDYYALQKLDMSSNKNEYHNKNEEIHIDISDENEKYKNNSKNELRGLFSENRSDEKLTELNENKTLTNKLTENKTIMNEITENKLLANTLAENKTFTKGSTKNKTLMEKEESLGDFFVHVINDDEDHHNRAPRTMKLFLNGEDLSGDFNRRRKRSILRRRYQTKKFETNQKKKLYSSILRKQSAQAMPDPKGEIVNALSQLESGFLKTRRSKTRIAVINDPHLRPAGPYIPPTSTTLAPCCTPPPPPPPPPKPTYFNMTGDHMNIYPEAPEWGYPDIDQAVPTMRNWWYYNQDDYQQLKPKIPGSVLRA